MKITLIGDGKYRKYLINKISKENLKNIELIKPLKQADLIIYYEETDFLFLNLNSYKLHEISVKRRAFINQC